MQDVFPIKFEDAEFEPLETFPNRNNNRRMLQIVQPEFSSVCPKTGYPDFGRVILKYIAEDRCLELKSWKLYLSCYYGVGVFHEDVTESILEDFTQAVQPKWCSLTIDWKSRGGIHTTTKLVWTKQKGICAFPDHWEDPAMRNAAQGWHNQ